MAAGTDDRPDFRGSTWERVLISRWIGHSVSAALMAMGVVPNMGFAFIYVHDSFPGLFSVSEGTMEALGYSIGGCVAAGSWVIFCAVRQREVAAVERGADPRRRRAARLALHRGELVDDPEANRIAASLARIYEGEVPNRWTLGSIRLFQIVVGGFAVLLAIALYFTVKYYGADSIAPHSVFPLLFLATVAVVVLPVRARTHVRTCRIVALQEAEAG